MITDQCISLTQLKGSFDFSKLHDDTFILKDNKPIAVLVNIEKYKHLTENEDFEASFNPSISPKDLLDAYHETYGR